MTTMHLSHGNSQHYRRRITCIEAAANARVLVLAIGERQAYACLHHRDFRYGIER